MPRLPEKLATIRQKRDAHSQIAGIHNQVKPRANTQSQTDCFKIYRTDVDRYIKLKDSSALSTPVKEILHFKAAEAEPREGGYA